jgi:hypothetical protein
MNVNRTADDLRPGMPDRECLVQMPPALGGALPGERFLATLENGVALRTQDGRRLAVTASPGDDYVLISYFRGGNLVQAGRKAFISWPE